MLVRQTVQEALAPLLELKPVLDALAVRHESSATPAATVAGQDEPVPPAPPGEPEITEGPFTAWRLCTGEPATGRERAQLAELLRRYDGPAALMSFNPHSVAAVAEAAPERPRGLTTCAFDSADWSLPDYRRAELAALADAERTGAAFVSHDHNDLDNPALARLKREGLPVLTWTIRSPAEEAAARRIADNITFEGYRPAIPAAEP